MVWCCVLCVLYELSGLVLWCLMLRELSGLVLYSYIVTTNRNKGLGMDKIKVKDVLCSVSVSM